MDDVFLAGPIDFQDLNKIIEYRVRFSDRLRSAGFEPVDQYADAFRLLSSDDYEFNANALMENIEDLPDEPYVRAVEHAVAATSLESVLNSPDLVPKHAPADVIAAVVERDLELVEGSDAFLAYLPQPSCGTTVELMHAVDNQIPTFIVSPSPPMFIQHFADQVVPDFDEAKSSLSGALE